MSIRRSIYKAPISRYLLPFLVIALVIGCSDSSEPFGDVPPGTPHDVTFPLDDAINSVTLVANQPTQVVTTLHMPPTVGLIDSASIDVAASLEHVSLSNVFLASNFPALVQAVMGQELASTIIRVGSDAETVCEQGRVYGPYSIGGVLGSPSVEVETISLDEPTIQTVNTGYAVICMEIVSSFNATVSVDRLEGSVTEAECGSPADFSGEWSGTYSCTNSCDDGFGGSISLTITQDGTNASYVDDGGDNYTGTVCGDVFRFERVEPHEIERGTMTFTSSNQATKRSTYRGQAAPYCGGDCTDYLTRSSGN